LPGGELCPRPHRPLAQARHLATPRRLPVPVSRNAPDAASCWRRCLSPSPAYPCEMCASPVTTDTLPASSGTATPPAEGAPVGSSFGGRHPCESRHGGSSRAPGVLEVLRAGQGLSARAARLARTPDSGLQASWPAKGLSNTSPSRALCLCNRVYRQPALTGLEHGRRGPQLRPWGLRKTPRRGRQTAR
jgi:hypothetical protein